MELNFEELETTLTNEPNEPNYVNYWSNANKTIDTHQKKKVSYDDILSSLNMVVNNGVLQFANPVQSNKTNKVQQSNQSNQTNKVQKKQVTIREPNSSNYITNKYFKDYKEPGLIEEPPKPMTKEEYRQMLIQDYIKRQEAQRRIAQIKSKKLLFHTNNINIAQNPNQMPRDMNKLFKPFKR
jgi:tRNA uridine 5-carbamoylmethylation protein Kti12